MLEEARAEALERVAAAKAELPALPEGSAPRWSWWPTRSPTATPSGDGSEVHRPDGVGGQRAREALDLLLHVGPGQALEVAHERLGAAVELLVEAVDRVLVVEADRVPLAVGAAELDLPVRRRGLLPLDGIDEGLVALGAEVEVERLAARRGRRAPARARRLVLEVDDLDRAAGREDDAADVVGVVWAGSCSDGSMGSGPYIGPCAEDLSELVAFGRTSRR